MDIIKFITGLLDLVIKIGKWLLEGDWKKKILVSASIAIVALMIVAVFSPKAARQQAYRGMWPWLAAAYPGRAIPLSDDQKESVDKNIDYLLRRVEVEFSDHLDKAKVAQDRAQRYTAWTLAQAVMALKGTEKEQTVNRNEEAVLAFLRAASREDPGCDCWQEHPGEASSPQSIGVTSWIIYSMTKIRTSPSQGELKFLQETQEATGAWNMFKVPFEVTPTLARPTGSAFATASAIIALTEVSKSDILSNQGLKKTVADMNRQAFLYFQYRKIRDASTNLWTLYPGWPGSTTVSLGTSGMVVYSLHQYVSTLNSRDAKFYEKDLTKIDKDFLDVLITSSDKISRVSDGDSFGTLLPYQPITSHSQPASVASADAGAPPVVTSSNRPDVVVSLRLPWMIVGTQVAYASGDYLQKVRALQFIRSALDSVESSTQDAVKERFWIAPEVLFSLRVLRAPGEMRLD